jgi:hypothetical protein
MPDRYGKGPRGRPGSEPRSFEERGRFSSDQARYYGADERDYRPPARTAGPRARGIFGSDEEHDYHAYPGDLHREQEYGLSAGGRERRPRHAFRSDPRREVPYGDEPLPHGADVNAFGLPADYAYHPDLQRDLDRDYLAWREERLRGHDRDYAQWRDEQRRRYDDEYRSFRQERRAEFGKSFTDWRSQRDAVSQDLSRGAETPDDKI